MHFTRDSKSHEKVIYPGKPRWGPPESARHPSFGEDVLQLWNRMQLGSIIDRRAGRIHRPVQVSPLAFSPHVGFVDAPTVVRRFEIPRKRHMPATYETMH
jgi:hypothetical protein